MAERSVLPCSHGMRLFFRRLYTFPSFALPYIRRFGVLAGIRVALNARLAQYAAVPGTLVEVRIPEFEHPFWLRAGTSDVAVFHQVIMGRELEQLRTANPAAVIDAGANIGLAALAFANWWPHARVLCMEVDADNLRQLERNVAPYSNVTVLPAGLWSRKAQLAIVNRDAPSWAFAVTEMDGGAIPALGVLDVMQHAGLARIGLLKLDVEGAEVEVLHSADQWLQHVDILCVELHDRYRTGCREALDAALLGTSFLVRQSGEYTVATRVT